MAETVQSNRRKPLGKTVVKGNHGVRVVKTCTIRRSPEELYRFWIGWWYLGSNAADWRTAIGRAADSQPHR